MATLIQRICAVALPLAVAGCAPPGRPPADPPGPAPAAPRAAPPALVEPGAAAPAPLDPAGAGIDPAALNPAADPCADFYRYACGGWLDSQPQGPAAEPWSRFREIERHATERLRSALDQHRADAADPLGRLYGACLEAPAGFDRSAAAPVLAAIDRATTPERVAAAVAALHRRGLAPLFALEVGPDRAGKTPLLVLVPDGLGLSDRRVYLAPGRGADRLAYRRQVARALEGTGLSRAAATEGARDVLAIEIELARFGGGAGARQPAVHELDRPALVRLAPGFDWASYLAALDRDQQAAFAVTDPDLLERIGRMTERVRPAAWRSYLRWHLVRRLEAPDGEARPRWCVDTLSRVAPARVSQRMAAQVLGAPGGDAAARLIESLRAAMAEARPAARDRLRALTVLLGAPDDAAEPLAEAASFGAAAMAAREAGFRALLARLDGAPGHDEWPLPGLTLDSYYDPAAHRLVLPASLLQPPVFGPERTVAANAGGLALVAGHHLGHAALDRPGGGKAGKPAAATSAELQCLADQYDGYQAGPGVRLDGARVAAEAAADLAGARAAYGAYQQARAGAPPLAIDGYAEDQIFFIALAQAWCAHAPEPDLLRQLARSPHAPPRWRVEGTVSNMPEFAAAFSCAEGTPLRRPAVCRPDAPAGD